ncbi:MAG: class I SAM-dependent methyltransferase [Ktedonobacteraceae bacterium]|nr:class I SAM-dependent methyltransferase [Ktedonobacteraceae bacterium]
MAVNDFKNGMKQLPMMKWLIDEIRKKLPKQQGLKRIQKVGHRSYVGGLWDEIGKLQFDFLLKEGLQPYHYLVDIACGSLRAGLHFIPYLETGHYLGIEKEESLIQAGIEKELSKEVYELKKPCFVVSSAFEFDKFKLQPDYALAQSLFTHLPPSYIHLCFKNLRGCIHDDGVFYATFWEVETERANPSKPNDRGFFGYTQQQMESFGSRNGWKPEYIGDWHHPRGQKMVRFRPA